jgi:DNA-binding MltR family transcriptional regulator
MQARVRQDAGVMEVFPYGPFKDIFGDRDPKDDRADAILAMAVMEQALEHAIMNCFNRSENETREMIFDGDAALARDLHSKLILVYIVEVIGKETLADLNLMRQIRNVFAHSRAVVNFDSPEICLACQKISLFRRIGPESERLVDGNPRKAFFNGIFEYSLWLFTYDIHREGFWGRAVLRA